MNARKRRAPVVAHRVLSAALALVFTVSTTFSGLSPTFAAEAPPAAAVPVAAAIGPSPAGLAAGPAAQEASPAVVCEVDASRTADSSTYVMSDGTRRTELFAGPVHFKDSSGAWADIDPSLVPTDTFGVSHTRASDYDETIASSDVTGTPLTVRHGDWSFGMKLLGAEQSDVVALGDTAVFPLAMTDTQLTFETSRAGTKDTLKLSSKAAPDTFTFFMPLQNLAAYPSLCGGGIQLFDTASKRAAATIEPLSVFDSSGSAENPAAVCTSATMSLTPAKGGAYVTYRVPRDWLDDPARVYPVAVDPQITYGGSDLWTDTFVLKGYPDSTACASDVLNIGWVGTYQTCRALLRFNMDDIPQGATIQDATLALYCCENSTSGSKTVFIKRVTGPGSQPWTKDASWNNTFSSGQLKYDSATSVAISGTGWKYWTGCGPMVQSWYDGSMPNKGFIVWDNADDTSADTYRRFHSAQYSSATYTPHMTVSYTVPSISGASFDKPSYRPGDIVNATVSVSSKTHPTNLQMNVMSGSTCRGRFIYTTSDPGTGSYQTFHAAGTSDYFSFDTSPSPSYTQGAVLPDLAHSTVSYDGSSCSVRFAYRLGDTYGDTQANHLWAADGDWASTRPLRDMGATYAGCAYSVLPSAASTASVVTTASAMWWREGAGNDDSATAGRGAVKLTWPAAGSASGYRIYLYDGNQYDSVATTTATSWSSSGQRLFPSDSAIAALPAGFAGNPFTSSGLDLRDDPRPLYAKTPGASCDELPAYAFKVVPFNSAGSSAISDNATIAVTLDCRTQHRADDPEHTSFDVGGIEGDKAQALLDSGALRLSATDLDIDTFGPEASLARTYDSGSCGSGYFGAPGWMFGFEQNVSANATGVVYTDAEGDRHVFAGSAASGWSSPVGLDATLTGVGGLGYTLAYRDRTTESFNSAGQFVSEADNNGLRTSVARGVDGGGHDTVTITAANGQAIVLTALGGGEATAKYSVAGQTREVDYSWDGSGSGASASGTETVSTVYSDSGPTPTRTSRYVYSAGKLAVVLVSASSPIAHTDGPAEWDFAYHDGVLATVTAPAYDSAGHRPVTGIAYGTDASGLADATVRQSGEVDGRLQDVTQTFGINPCGTTAYRTNPRTAADDVELWSYTYAPGGYLASETNPDGAVTRSICDAFGDELLSIDAMGRVTRSLYDANETPISTTDPAGGITEYRYDANGNLACTTRSLNASGDVSCTRSEYDAGSTWRLTCDLLELSAAPSTSRWLRTDCSYDSGNGTARPSRTTQSGRVGDSAGKNIVAEAIDLGGGDTTPSITTMVGYDGWGDPITSVDASGGATTRSFDAAGDLLTSTDAMGLTTNQRYDAFGHAVSAWQSRADTAAVVGYTQTDFDAFGRAVEQRNYLTTTATSTAVLNSTVDHFFDALGEETGSHDAATPGSDAAEAHDAAGNCTRSLPAGLAAGQSGELYAERSAFDAEGRETSSTAAGATVPDTKAYNSDGTLCSEIRPDGTSTAYSYDAAGNIVSESVNSTAGVSITRRSYDLGGRLVASFDADGSETDYVYDLVDRAVSARGPEEPSASSTAYNALDWVTAETDADGIATSNRYDVRGQLVSQTVGSGQGPTRTSTDAVGRLLSQTDPNGRQLSNVYDGFGRVTRESQLSTTNPSIPISQRTIRDTITAYDAGSRVASSTDAKCGLTTTFSYPDPGTCGQTLRTVSYGGLSTTIMVDGAGNEVSRDTNASGLALRRSIDSTDQAGRITGWHLGGLTRSTTFDSDGRVSSQNGSGFSAASRPVYDGLVGKKSEDHVPLAASAGGPIDWAYAYSADRRLATATPAGQQGESFRYDDGGNVTAYSAVTDRLGSTQSGVLHYDAAARLDKRFGADGATLLESFGYDPAQGARGSQKRSGEASVTYTYTGQQGLASYMKPAGALGVAASVSATYAYEATGQRLHSSVTTSLAGASSSTETTWTYQGTTLLSLAASQTAAGGSSWRTAYLYDDENSPYAGIYQSNSASPTAFGIVTTDHGDVVALTDMNGEPFANYRYDPWGRPLGPPAVRASGLIGAPLGTDIASRQVLRYAGYAFDAETGFYYCSARTYDPSTMQFLQKDPAKSDGEDSAYQYCGGDPVCGSDPTGLISPDTIDAYGGQAAVDRGTRAAEKALSRPKKKHRTQHHSSSSGGGSASSSSYSHQWKDVGIKPPDLKGLSAEQVVVKWARSRVGGEYVFGAAMPRTGREWSNYPLDCSNLTAVAYRLAHRIEPSAWPLLDDYSPAQHDATKGKSLGYHKTSASLRIGDLGFLHRDNGTVHHVGLYVGRGWVIEAKGHAYGVVRTSLGAFNARGADWHRGRRD